MKADVSLGNHRGVDLGWGQSPEWWGLLPSSVWGKGWHIKLKTVGLWGAHSVFHVSLLGLSESSYIIPAVSSNLSSSRFYLGDEPHVFTPVRNHGFQDVCLVLPFPGVLEGSKGGHYFQCRSRESGCILVHPKGACPWGPAHTTVLLSKASW